MQKVLHRDDIIRGLKQLADKATKRGISADIYVVGGAALTLRYFDRQPTVDIDARVNRWEEISPIVEEISRENLWVENWFNVKASQFVPSWGKNAEWELIYSSAGINIFVASAEVLLMMKLAASRRGRDYLDAELLMSTTGLTDRQEIETLFSQYFPGDVLPAKAVRMLDDIFSKELSAAPTPPISPAFD